MKINRGITTGNIIQIVILVLGLAVLWGTQTTKMSYVELELEQKADKDIVEVQFDYITKQLEEVKQMLRGE